MNTSARSASVKRSFLALISVLLIASFAAGCSSARKQRENRKKREALVDKHGLYCDLVKVDPDLEMEVELNIRMANSCESTGQHSITYYPLDSEIRGILYCCTHKKPELPPSTESVDSSANEKPAAPATHDSDKKAGDLSAPKKH